MQMKTTRRCHLTPAEWLLSVNPQKTSVGWHVEKREPSCIVKQQNKNTNKIETDS